MEFLTGHKKRPNEEYGVQIELRDERNNLIVIKNEKVESREWHRLEIKIAKHSLQRPLSNSLIKFIVKSDTFTPSELFNTKDHRKLGIAIHRLGLINKDKILLTTPQSGVYID